MRNVLNTVYVCFILTSPFVSGQDRNEGVSSREYLSLSKMVQAIEIGGEQEREIVVQRLEEQAKSGELSRDIAPHLVSIVTKMAGMPHHGRDHPLAHEATTARAVWGILEAARQKDSWWKDFTIKVGLEDPQEKGICSRLDSAMNEAGLTYAGVSGDMNQVLYASPISTTIDRNALQEAFSKKSFKFELIDGDIENLALVKENDDKKTVDF